MARHPAVAPSYDKHARNGLCNESKKQLNRSVLKCVKANCYDPVLMPNERSQGGAPKGKKARGSFRLDDQLCFALYAASRAVTQRYRPLLDELGLTYPQYLVMLVLWEHGPTTVKGLADSLQLDYGTLSPLLKRLSAAGLVERRRRSEDERSVEITLTDAGEELKTRAAAIPQLVVDAYNLDADDFEALRTSLRELTDSVSTPPRRATGDARDSRS
jgi:MarR family transcriptional regulator, organic hydroperoxide resistance regulator